MLLRNFLIPGFMITAQLGANPATVPPLPLAAPANNFHKMAAENIDGLVNILPVLQHRTDFATIAAWAVVADPIKVFKKIHPGWAENYDASFEDNKKRLIEDLILQEMQAHLDFVSGKNSGSEREIAAWLNAAHGLPDQIRFQIVARLNAGGYYQLLSEGRSEAYTSSFKYLYLNFAARFQEKNRRFSDFLREKPERLAMLPKFIDGVSGYGWIGHFLDRIGAEEKQLLLLTIFEQIKQSPLNVVAAANFVESLKAGDPAIALFESKLLENYSTATGRAKDAFGLLGSWYAQKTGGAEFKIFAGNPRYHLQDFSKLAAAQLFDGQKRNFQLHMFYNDNDGMANYAAYRADLKQGGWSINEDASSRTAHFKKSAVGYSIDIYAVMPKQGLSVAENLKVGAHIQNIVAGQGEKITFVAHHGHSFTVPATISLMNNDTALVFLGSCGGTEYVASSLKAAPQAQIVTTSGIGRRAINQDLLQTIDQKILSGNDIDWLGFERSDQYMMPQQNMALLFTSKLLQLYTKDARLTAQTAAPALAVN